MSYTRDGDRVLLALGIAAGTAARDEQQGADSAAFRGWLRLANAINEGNPEWTPYAVPGGAQCKNDFRT